MSVSGTSSDSYWVIAIPSGYTQTVVAHASLPYYLNEIVVPTRCHIGGVQAYASVAGSGAGSTVLDIQRNGTSIFNQAADRPTLASGSTGAFSFNKPGTIRLDAGDRLSLVILSDPGTNTHGRISLSVALEQRAKGITSGG